MGRVAGAWRGRRSHLGRSTFGMLDQRVHIGEDAQRTAVAVENVPRTSGMERGRHNRNQEAAPAMLRGATHASDRETVARGG